MTKDDDADNVSDIERLRDLPLRSEEIGYSAGEMIACLKCSRSNAPDRAQCIYCGAEIAGVSARKKLDLRALEIWENGFNVIVISIAVEDLDRTASKVASMLGVEPGVIQPILGSAEPLPVARTETEEQAVDISERLAEIGITTRIVSDMSLQPSLAPVRLRSIEFGEQDLGLMLFNTGERSSVHRNDLALIVPAVLVEERTESVEKRKRGATRTLSESQTSSDSQVIDLYSGSDPTGWRVQESGFDFSCLGDQKSLIAGENLEKLVARLCAFAPGAKLIDGFADHRSMLEHCWPSESRKDAFGFQRSGFARKDLSSVRTTNNSIQLTKYSRLQWQLR